MRRFALIASLAALALAGCSGSKKDAEVPNDKKVGNFVYAPPRGANGQASPVGAPGVKPGSANSVSNSK